MKKSTHKRLTAWLLTLVMALSLLPTTAFAASYAKISVNDILLGDNYYLKSNSAMGSDYSNTEPSSYVAWYKNGVLTLKGYNGKGIVTQGVAAGELTVKLIGSNSINNGALESDNGGDITVTSDSSGTLSISKTTSGSNPAIGIETGLSASYTTGNVTIKGNAKVTINMTHNGTSTYEKAYGIFAKDSITISENASVDITCATPNNTTGGGNCNGLYAAKDVTIDTNGTIKIDVTNAGRDKDNGYSYGVYYMRTATLTKVGNMEVQWKKEGNNTRYSGGAFIRGVTFSDTDHAINEDTTNCYASYRYATSYYTVTAGNGKLTGPGVKYPNGNGKFLVGDTVNIKPNEKKSSDGTPIPFKKWISEGVALASPTTPNTSFNVPTNDVTVTATYNPFDGAPVFTRTSDSSGTIKFKTVANPDNSEFFEYVKDGETAYNRPYSQPTTTSSASPYEYSVSVSTYYAGDIKNLEAGDYRMAVTLNGERYLSEKFTVKYTAAPTTNISVSGTIKSYNPNNATTIQLMQGSMEKYKTTIDPASGSSQMAQDFTFDAVAKGTYDLVVTKPGHLTYTVKNVEVGDTDLDLTKHSNAAISMITLLCGDIVKNGYIDFADYQELLSPANYGKKTTDTGVNALADLNGNGYIDFADYQILLSSQHYGKSAVSVNFGE